MSLRAPCLLAAALSLAGCPPTPGVDDDDSADDAYCEQVDSDPGVGPSGYPMDGWGWQRDGLVAETELATEHLDGWISPAIVDDHGTLHLWATRKLGLEHTMFHATATQWGQWSALEPTTGLGEESQAYPSVVRGGDGFRMWFGSGSVDLATSADGVDWTIEQAMVLTAGGEGDFDDLSVLYPAVAQGEDEMLMLYTGFDGATFRIGEAASTDGGFTWSKRGVVVEPGAVADFDNHAVAQTSLALRGSGWKAWYGGYDTSQSDPGPYRIGLVSRRYSDDAQWEKQGLTLDLSEEGSDAWSTRDPAVVWFDGAWRMVYAGLAPDGHHRLLSATSLACTP
jgi:hypothetical protein